MKFLRIYKIGDRKKAFIKFIREDGKIDVSLQKIGSKKSDDSSQKVLEILNKKWWRIKFYL